MEPTRYRITVRGPMSECLRSAFDGLDLEPGDAQIALIGDIRDQSHLFGVLHLARGLQLVSVEPDRATPAPGDAPGDGGERGLDQAGLAGADHRLLPGFEPELAVDRP